MNYYWYFTALAIGYCYAQKQGREAVLKINKFLAEKENQNNNL